MADWINDGGHGGSDPGAVAKGNTEKVYTLEAELYVHKRLKDHGISNDVTRTSDVTLDENPRVNKVKNYKYCLSHHFNAGGGNGAEFIHSIYSDGKFEKMLADEFKKAGYPLRPRAIFTRKGSNGQDYYYMHRRTGACRTTIIEYDFVDGANSEKIKDKKYREAMYECVVKTVCKQEGKSYKPLNQPKKDTNSVLDGNKQNVYVNGKKVAYLDNAHLIAELVEKEIKNGAKKIVIE
ncbi:N-acetylmuramoyl-L-alanine amidase [Cytobacillus oceanisediminis]|uniref:MurNAc-LAA domain-containing protein n=1 Tax=Cytobacillus oceanisediminis 2691 TaxID=1196031 RepID=A0A160MA04_9BACI|nr:N-acetylmuramoyl-L-alanine amidase [Cytobacillus oceanisediminis]AND39557.1 hypothetical protein A361_10570 [Cytobacillus oceanisediminis 2691]